MPYDKDMPLLGYIERYSNGWLLYNLADFGMELAEELNLTMVSSDEILVLLERVAVERGIYKCPCGTTECSTKKH